MQGSSKFHCQTRHAIQRARQRYGLLLGFKELKVLAQRVAAGLARHVRDDVWLVDWEGRTLRLVYSTETDAIVTFLPP